MPSHTLTHSLSQTASTGVHVGQMGFLRGDQKTGSEAPFLIFICRNFTRQRELRAMQDNRNTVRLENTAFLCVPGYFLAGYDLFRGGDLCRGERRRYHSALLLTAAFPPPQDDDNLLEVWLMIESELFHVSICLHTQTLCRGLSLNRSSHQGFRLTHERSDSELLQGHQWVLSFWWAP